MSEANLDSEDEVIVLPTDNLQQMQPMICLERINLHEECRRHNCRLSSVPPPSAPPNMNYVDEATVKHILLNNFKLENGAITSTDHVMKIVHKYNPYISIAAVQYSIHALYMDAVDIWFDFQGKAILNLARINKGDESDKPVDIPDDKPVDIKPTYSKLNSEANCGGRPVTKQRPCVRKKRKYHADNYKDTEPVYNTAITFNELNLIMALREGNSGKCSLFLRKCNSKVNINYARQGEDEGDGMTNRIQKEVVSYNKLALNVLTLEEDSQTYLPLSAHDKYLNALGEFRKKLPTLHAVLQMVCLPETRGHMKRTTREFVQTGISQIIANCLALSNEKYKAHNPIIRWKASQDLIGISEDVWKSDQENVILIDRIPSPTPEISLAQLNAESETESSSDYMDYNMIPLLHDEIKEETSDPLLENCFMKSETLLKADWANHSGDANQLSADDDWQSSTGDTGHLSEKIGGKGLENVIQETLENESQAKNGNHSAAMEEGQSENCEMSMIHTKEDVPTACYTCPTNVSNKSIKHMDSEQCGETNSKEGGLQEVQDKSSLSSTTPAHCLH